MKCSISTVAQDPLWIISNHAEEHDDDDGQDDQV